MNDRLLSSALALAACAAFTSPETLDVRELSSRFRDAAEEDPMATAVATLLVGSAVFYAAEKGQNPKVETFADALDFVSTGMSVGYSDIFPRTEVGKLVSTVMATVGPALTAGFLDDPKDKKREETHDAALLAKLDEILVALKDRRS